MGLFIATILVKIITGILCAVLLPIVFIIAGVKSLIDGICYGYWHEDSWAEIPDIFRELCEHFKTPVFE